MGGSNVGSEGGAIGSVASVGVSGNGGWVGVGAGGGSVVVSTSESGKRTDKPGRADGGATVSGGIDVRAGAASAGRGISSVCPGWI